MRRCSFPVGAAARGIRSALVASGLGFAFLAGAGEFVPSAILEATTTDSAHPPSAMTDGDPSTWTRFVDAGTNVVCSFVVDAGAVRRTVGLRFVSQPGRWVSTSPCQLSVSSCADGRSRGTVLSRASLSPALCCESQFVTWPATNSRLYRVEIASSGWAGVKRVEDYCSWGYWHALKAWGHDHNHPKEPRVVDVAEIRLLEDVPEDLPAWNAHPARAFPRSRLEKDWLLQDFGFEGFARAAATNPPSYYAACEARRRCRLAGLAKDCPRFVYTRHFTIGGDAELSGNAMTSDSSATTRAKSWKPGGQLCQLTIHADGTVSNEVLLDRPEGCIRDPDVSPDGRKVLFAMRNKFPSDLAARRHRGNRRTLQEVLSPDGDDYHLYTLDLETRALRQLTFPDPYPCADFEGVWISGDRILFQSTRCQQIIPCHVNENANLYVCNADGTGIRRIGFDGGSTMGPQELPDGRFIFTRYEYNDRNARQQQPLFQMGPAFTLQTEYYGNNSIFPTSLLHFRPVPDSDLVLGIASGHHVAQKGKLVLIDRSLGTQGDEGLFFVAGSDPDGRPGRVRSHYDNHPVMQKARGARNPVVDDFSMLIGDQWQNPYPLSTNEWVTGYLPEGSPCGSKYAENPNFGIYWQNAQGERELLAYDPAIGCSQPVPVRRRTMPAVRPAAGDPASAWGGFYVQDVYRGPGLKGVPRGTVKTLRVVAIENRPTFLYRGSMKAPHDPAYAKYIAYEGDISGEALGVPGSAWDVKHVLGEVPVEADGSCAFEAPCCNPVYFQLLDGKGRCVQTMRSWTVLQPGEVQGCVGCHESKYDAPSSETVKRLVVRKLSAAAGQPAHPLLERLRTMGRLGSLDGFMGVHAVRSLDPDAPVEGFSFRRRIQPILDGNCVRCHDGTAKNRPDLTGREAEDRRMEFSKPGLYWRVDGHRRLTRSYLALTDKGRQSERLNWYSSTGISEMLPPYAQGSSQSRLTAYFEGAHHGVQATDAERRVVACWIDLGIPFVGSYCEATDWTDDDRRIYDYHQRKRAAFADCERRELMKRRGDE